MNDSPRILIIRLSSLGDILHALPAFLDLRTSFPKAKIDWLAGKKCSHLLSAVCGIDTLHVVDTSGLLRFPLNRNAWRQLWSVMRRLRGERYDVSLDFQGLLKTAFLGLLSGASRRLGFSRELVREPPAHWLYQKVLQKPQGQFHVVDLNRMLAGVAGARPFSGPVDLVVSDEDARFVNSLLQNERLTDFVVINPGGGWPTKIWPPERYGHLAARIQSELDLPVIVTTGPGERALYDALAAGCGANPPHHFQLTFMQLIPLLKKARLLIGGDTGPFHLACALGTPVTGIYGPTSPARNGPWSDGNETICRALPCSFCHKRRCPTSNECMDIATEEVYEAVIRQLEKAGPVKTKYGSKNPESKTANSASARVSR
jgi:heptosyltransferase I